MHKMLNNNFIVGYLNIGGNLTTNVSRTAWEDAFMATYLNPVLSVSFYINIFGSYHENEPLLPRQILSGRVRCIRTIDCVNKLPLIFQKKSIFLKVGKGYTRRKM